MNNSELEEYLEDIKLNFLLSEPVIGYILTNIIIKENNKIPTARIFFNNEEFKYQIEYSYKFLLTLENLKMVTAIFKHEIYHMMYKHHFRAIELKNKNGFLDMKTANVAMDIAINQHINNLPDFSLSYKNYNVPMELSFENYYSLLYKSSNSSSENGKNKDGSSKSNSLNDLGKDDNNSKSSNSENNEKDKKDKDSQNKSKKNDGFSGNGKKEIKNINENHSDLIESINNENIDLIENTTKDIVKDAIKKSSSHYGYDGTNDELNELWNTQTYISWKKIIKQFQEKTILTSNKYDTWKKMNRRFDFLKGKKRIKESEILVAIDTSGSISKEIIYSFINELKNIIKLSFLKTVYFNTKTYNFIKNIKKEENSLKNIQSGGTIIQSPIDFAKKNKFKNLIIMTDGFGEETLNLYSLNIIFINHLLTEILIPKEKILKSYNLFKNYPVKKVSSK